MQMRAMRLNLVVRGEGLLKNYCKEGEFVDANEVEEDINTLAERIDELEACLDEIEADIRRAR